MADPPALPDQSAAAGGPLPPAREKKALLETFIKITEEYFSSGDLPPDKKLERLLQLLEQRQLIIKAVDDNRNKMEMEVAPAAGRPAGAGQPENNRIRCGMDDRPDEGAEEVRALLLRARQYTPRLERELLLIKEALEEDLKQLKSGRQKMSAYHPVPHQNAGVFLDQKK
ncbi:MAG: hypothetical protein K6T80_04995 [Firmicutes bacterium]|nr:hypothetical protein [Bacillota bacterium]